MMTDADSPSSSRSCRGCGCLSLSLSSKRHRLASPQDDEDSADDDVEAWRGFLKPDSDLGLAPAQSLSPV